MKHVADCESGLKNKGASGERTRLACCIRRPRRMRRWSQPFFRLLAHHEFFAMARKTARGARALPFALFLLFAVFIFPGCKKSSEPSRQKLVLFCMSEYVPQKLIDAFTKETGIAVAQENYASNEEMIAKLTSGAGAYDLVQP